MQYKDYMKQKRRKAMRIFNHPNIDNGWECPICHQATDKPVVIIGIAGTCSEVVNKTIQAEQFHLDCLEFIWFKDDDIIAMKI